MSILLCLSKCQADKTRILVVLAILAIHVPHAIHPIRIHAFSHSFQHPSPQFLAPTLAIRNSRNLRNPPFLIMSVIFLSKLFICLNFVFIICYYHISSYIMTQCACNLFIFLSFFNNVRFFFFKKFSSYSSNSHLIFSMIQRVFSKEYSLFFLICANYQLKKCNV